jgi:hypothetical protein
VVIRKHIDERRFTDIASSNKSELGLIGLWRFRKVRAADQVFCGGDLHVKVES